MNTASEDRDWPGTAPRVPGDGDFEEVLRHALRSAAENFEPTGDGLTQIFRRVAAPWLVRQVWLLATDCVDLLRLIIIWLQPMVARAVAVLAAAGGSVHEAFRRLTSQAPAAAPISAAQYRRGQARAAVFWGKSPALETRARARAAVAWLRPAVPVAVAAAVVMTGTVALSQTVARIELSGKRGLAPPRSLARLPPPAIIGNLRSATAPGRAWLSYPLAGQEPPRLVAAAPRTSIPAQPQDARPARPGRPHPDLRQHPPRRPLPLPARARHRPPRLPGRTTILTSLILIRLISPTRLIQARQKPRVTDHAASRSDSR